MTTVLKSIDVANQREDAIRNLKLQGEPVIWEDGGFADVKLTMFPIVILYDQFWRDTQLVFAIDGTGGVVSYEGAHHMHFVMREVDESMTCLSVYKSLSDRLAPGVQQMKEMGYFRGAYKLDHGKA